MSTLESIGNWVRKDGRLALGAGVAILVVLLIYVFWDLPSTDAITANLDTLIFRL